MSQTPSEKPAPAVTETKTVTVVTAPGEGRGMIVIGVLGAISTVAAAIIGLVPYWMQKADKPEESDPPVASSPAVDAPVTPVSQPAGVTPTTPATAASGEKPPVSLSFRKSQIWTKGLVAGLTNNTSRELKEIVVSVRGAKEAQSRSYHLKKSVKPKDSVSFGWMELDGWKLKPGDVLHIEAKGLSHPVEETVPAVD